MANTEFAKINGTDGSVAYKNQGSHISSAQRIGTGRYQVNFSPAFPGSKPPVVVAMVMNDGDTCDQAGVNCAISVTHVTNTQICFGITRASDCRSEVDCSFNFIASAPTS